MEDATLLLWVERGKIPTGFFVAIGVAGEFLGDFIASPIIKRRDSAQRAEIARLNKEAGEARNAAGEAVKQAANAEKQAAQAGEGTAKALAQAAKLELEASQQRERAAKAEHDLLELQQRIKPRRFTAEQSRLLIDALKRSPAKGLVELDCVLGDVEGRAFAIQIDEILKAASWPSTGVNQAAFSGRNPIGFGTVVHAAVTAPPYALALQEAFESVGLPLDGAEDAKLAEGTLRILIGNKPQ
jgi:hypothetical protein